MYGKCMANVWQMYMANVLCKRTVKNKNNLKSQRLLSHSSLSTNTSQISESVSVHTKFNTMCRFVFTSYFCHKIYQRHNSGIWWPKGNSHHDLES